MSTSRALPPVVLTVLAVLAVLGGTIAAGSPVPALVLAQSGHWVLDRAAAAAVHVDGGTHRPDAQVALPADAVRDGMVTVQGAESGYVVGRNQVWTFAKSTLTVVGSAPSAATEVPIPVEVVGGPYLVYQQAGTVVRLGTPPVVTHAPGKLGRPVRTEDGTVWVAQPESGDLCALRRNALDLDCSIRARPGAPGGLTVTASTATFVDAGVDVEQLVHDGALDAGGPVGVDLPDDVLLGDRAAGTRLPVVTPTSGLLRLLDASGFPARSPGGPPIDVALGSGRFSAPVVSGSVIVVLELITGRLFTFAPGGARLSVTQLAAGTDASAISTGEDGRIYIDEPGGGSTRIVQPDGSLATVPLGTGQGGNITVAPPTEQQKPVTPPQPGRVMPVPVPKPVPDPVHDPVPPVVTSSTAPPLPPPSTEAPTAPTGVTATLAGADQATVTWQASDGHGLPVQYAVTVNGGPGTVAVAGTKATVSGLAAATTYTFSVTARSSAGASPAADSNSIATVSVVPLPTAVTARRVNNSGSIGVDVKWQPPVGATISYYEVTFTGKVASGVRNVTNTTFTDTALGTGANAYTDNYCSPTVTYAVRSVSPDRRKSAPANFVVDDAVDCTFDTVVQSATANADGSIGVQVECFSAGHGPQTNSPMDVRFDGVSKDSTKECNHTGPDSFFSYTITGLAPATTYAVTVRTTSPTGTKTSDPVSVTTVG